MSMLSRLSTRERWLVTGAVVFVGAALAYTVVAGPLVEKGGRYSRMAETKRRDLLEFRELAAQYRSLQGSLRGMEARVASKDQDTSLLAAMESEARKLGLADRISSMKPFTSDLDSGMVQSSVEMRVEKIDLKGLVQFLQAIESGRQTAVTTRLRIKTRFDDPQLLDATILVSVLEAA